MKLPTRDLLPFVDFVPTAVLERIAEVNALVEHRLTTPSHARSRKARSGSPSCRAGTSKASGRGAKIKSKSRRK